ncbi:MAG TPA: acyltransferase [Steroidobacteraceae bacterium]|nr:acyltransferase [Steroidobacteraceae bacterium]
MAPRLSDFRGRDNNFNLIRMLAALLVIEAHACAVTHRADFLRPFCGLGGGDLGVDIFFVLSGYLIAKSWTGKSWQEFAWARIMRIYPALWVSTILSIVLVGLFFSEPGFFSRSSTLSYVWHNATMLPHFSAQTDLPGAFGTGHDFNISLWTLPYELQMYLTLAVVGVIVGLRVPYIALLALAGACLMLHLFGPSGVPRGRFLYFFFSGALAFVLRERITLDGRIALVLAGAVAASFFAALAWREATLELTLPYLVLWCAYIPSGFIRLWNRLGDYSYGSYIFAHPIQMGLAAYGLTTIWWSNILASVAIILPLAALSWHFLEKRALGLPLPRVFGLSYGTPKSTARSTEP